MILKESLAITKELTVPKAGDKGGIWVRGNLIQLKLIHQNIFGFELTSFSQE
jgi:hypothetical protein